SGGWRERWEVAADHNGPHPLSGTELHLDGEASQDRYQLVTYCHYQLDSRQCEPIGDEYGYNGGERAPPARVHDFMMECNLEVSQGDGSILLGITDGQDHFIVEISAGQPAGARLVRVDCWPPQRSANPWPGERAARVQAAR